VARRTKALAVAAEPVEGPWELPEGWRWERLDTVAPVNPRRGFDLPDDAEIAFVPMAAVSELNGVIDVSASRPVTDVRTGYTKFASGDVLFAKITPCMENGKVAIVPDLLHGVGAGSTEFHVIQPEGVLPRFVFFWLIQQWFRDEAEANMTGTAGQKRVPTDYLRGVTVPVPPKDVQDRIVARIDELFAELDDGEAGLARARDDLETYRKALLKAAVTGELTADWRAANPPQETGEQLLQRILKERKASWEADPKNRGKRYKEPVGIDQEGLTELPDGWTWISLEALSLGGQHSISDGPFGSNLKSEHYRETGPRVVRLQNIGKEGDFVDAKAHISTEHHRALERHHIESGDPSPGLWTRLGEGGLHQGSSEQRVADPLGLDLGEQSDRTGSRRE
jgi:type I restriction enzyme S subunit